MKIIHIESGLGNQMLSYCEFLAMKSANPQDEVYIETAIFDIPECNEVICQWNGYELERIFGITAPNIREVLGEAGWEQFMEEVRATRFWERNWNYPVHFTQAFNRLGLDITNFRGDFEAPDFKFKLTGEKKQTWQRSMKNTRLVMELHRLWITYTYKLRRRPHDFTPVLFPTTEKNLFAGQHLYFKFKGSDLQRIEKEVRAAFRFPLITEAQNGKTLQQIQTCTSVGIHARRGDLLKANRNCYGTGYFKRAVSYIKSQVRQPVFYVFCEPGGAAWVRENTAILGLDSEKDAIHVVDWNTGEESFRDMQLMAACKHQVFTNSSFGWWGAWLNENPHKITCAPSPKIIATHDF